MGVSQCSSYPLPPRVPVQWYGKPETMEICHNDVDPEECIRADDPAFGNMRGFSSEDTIMIQRYIVELQTKCERWRQ